MKKLVLTVLLAGAFTVGSTFAGSCGGGGEKCDGKGKDKGTKESCSYQVNL